jgi:hypothetical protein
MDYISLDRYNNNAHCSIDDVSCTFSSYTDFLEKTKFPFNIGLLSWEPERSHYVVERPNISPIPPTVVTGDHLEEILWISENKENLKSYCSEYLLEHTKDNIYTPSLREQRTYKLYEVAWVLERHQEQKLLSISTTLTEEKFKEVLTYRQALRDITKTYDSISTVVWPPNPLE